MINFFKHKITSNLKKIFQKIGLTISVRDVKILNLTKFKLSGISIKDKTKKTLIEVECITCKIYLWKSLFCFRLIGQFMLRESLITWPVIVNNPLPLKLTTILFAIRSKMAAIYVEIENLSFLFHVFNRKKRLVIQTESTLNWNSYLLIFQPNLYFEYLKYFCSSDQISINSLIVFSKDRQDNPSLNVNIKWENFMLKERNFPIEYIEIPTIDKQSLLYFLGKRYNNDKDKYILLDHIPVNFISAIICSEDPNFWQHKGIDIGFINYAIMVNIQNKRFERGASTITMQLVRNLFLNHDKNVFRKVEESIITLLLENYYKISKKDILEIYINLLEFAPSIRGLHDASYFYFGKPYTELTLTECIVLTYIIPRPKHFYEALLIKSDQLKKNLYSHICMYANVMKRKGFISNSEYNNICCCIRFVDDFGLLRLVDDAITEKREVKHLVVHCTGASQNQLVSNILSRWKSYGWRNPGYHYLIKADGTYLQLHPESLPSNGVKGHNQESIHICYMGGVDERGDPIDNRTPAQKQALLTILKELVQRYPIARILGHRDFLKEDNLIMKSCPCFDAKKEYADLHSF